MDDLADFLGYLLRQIPFVELLDEWWNGGGGPEADDDPAGSGT